jgi:hypothetical protein
MKQKVEEILQRIKPSLGGADVQLVEIKNGTVTIKYYKPLSGSTCKLVMGSTTKKAMRDDAVEIVEEQLKKELPDIEKVIVL